MKILPPSLIQSPNQITLARAKRTSVRNYPVVQQISSLPTIAGNCSTAAYNPLLDTIMVSDNGTPVLHEFRSDGTYRRAITLSGYVDVECVTWIEGTRYALGEETNTGVTNTITEVSIPANGTPITVTKGGGNWIRTLLLSSITSGANLGIEGICYDRRRHRFMCVTEKANAAVWNVWYTTSRTTGTGTQLFSLVAPLAAIGVTDISDMHHDPIEDAIYLSSHESSRIVKFSMTGQVLDVITLPSVHTQCEGITFTPDMRRMWITGEAKTWTAHASRYV